MSYRTWTDEDLKIAVKSSNTKSEVIRKLRLGTKSSGNFQTIDKYIKSLHLDVSHFKSEIHGHSIKEWSLKDILLKNSPYTNTPSLKKKLLKHNLLENKCYGDKCGITEWHGQKLSLQLDHINGDNTDNRIENLRLLCPNCHSLTPTFCRGKFAKKEYKCPDCGKKVCKQFARCQKCAGLTRRGKVSKIFWPCLGDLLQMVKESGYSEVGRRFGVSDNAVRKHIKKMQEFNAPYNR